MKRRVRVNAEASTVYIPKEVVEDGLRGECDAYADAFTFTIVKPGASLDQVRRSLELVLKDVEMRMEPEAAKAR